MAISQEKLLQVRELLEHLDHQTSREMENRRRNPRLPVRMTISATLLTGPVPTKVDIYTRNFSLAGFGFISRRLFRMDERVAIFLEFPKAGSKLVLARVSFGRYVSNGLHEMGTEFLECISNPKNPHIFPSHWSHSPVRPAP